MSTHIDWYNEANCFVAYIKKGGDYPDSDTLVSTQYSYNKSTGLFSITQGGNARYFSGEGIIAYIP